MLASGMLALTLAIASAVPGIAEARPSETIRLKAFSSCKALVAYGQRYAGKASRGSAAPAVGIPAPVRQGAPAKDAPDGAVPPAPAAPAPASAPGSGDSDSSRTNVQEEGVDEPDIVKSDGRRIFTLANGKLLAVDGRAEKPRLLGSLDMSGYDGELLLFGDRVLVLFPNAPVIGGGPVAARSASTAPYWNATSRLIEVDVSDPSAMRVLRTLEVDGSVVSARLNGATARVVVASTPRALVQGEQGGRAKSAGWLPGATLRKGRARKGTRRKLASCRAVRRPRTYSGLNMLSVLTIDMEKGLPAVDVDALMSDANTVYASTTGLYVATQRWVAPPVAPGQEPPPLTTAIHRFDISTPGKTEYRASGEVTGSVLNQFSLSEYKGVLRVASTDTPSWWGGRQQRESESFVTTLEERAGALAQLGRVGGLGRGERIYAVRFIDDAGFVVTFRQVDPLYTLDLSVPAAPKVLGELKILGYSAYLHPIGDGLLLGIGQDATEEGRRAGVQLSLFDVSDLSKPVRIAQRALGGSSSTSTVEYDHRALLFWPKTSLAVLPVQLFEEREANSLFSGAIGFRVRREGISEVGRISHPAAQGDSGSPVERTLVMGDRLFTLSALGLKSSDLATLSDQAFVRFPAVRSEGGGVLPPGTPLPAPPPPTAMP
ncbi:MAG: beta-propeller domain-containing protein [Solirubrobacteraceae bacterium]